MKKIITIIIFIIMIILSFAGINEIIKSFIKQASRYEIIYNDGGIGAMRDYCFYVDDHYKVFANETMHGSALNSITNEKNYKINISENNKKYLENILNNITEYNDEPDDNKDLIDFKIIDKRINKTYLIKYGSKEYIMFKYIFIYKIEINEDEIEKTLNDESNTKIM